MQLKVFVAEQHVANVPDLQGIFVTSLSRNLEPGEEREGVERTLAKRRSAPGICKASRNDCRWPWEEERTQRKTGLLHGPKLTEVK